MASRLGYVPIPHLFEGLLSVMARLVPGDGMSLVRNIVSDVISHKHRHFLTLGLIFTIWTASSGVAALIDALMSFIGYAKLARSGRLGPLRWD
jgi:membrane protein